jgi:hypothetical protein
MNLFVIHVHQINLPVSGQKKRLGVGARTKLVSCHTDALSAAEFSFEA